MNLDFYSETHNLNISSLTSCKQLFYNNQARAENTFEHTTRNSSLKLDLYNARITLITRGFSCAYAGSHVAWSNYG